MCAVVTRTPNPADVKNFVIDLVREKAGMEPELRQPLAYSGIDSFTLAELSYEIEQHYRVALGERTHELQTLDELIAYVGQLRVKD